MRLALPSIRLAATLLFVTCSGPAFGQLCQTGSQSFGRSADEWFTEYLPGPGGSLYLAGGKASANSDLLALRFDSTGAADWGRTFGSSADEEQEGGHVDLSATGGVYLTGIVPAGGFANDALLVKYAHDGTLRFARQWDSGSGADDQTGSAAQDAAGNLYLGGNSRGQNGSFDVLFLRFAPTPGATLPTTPFARTWGSGGDDEAINNFVVDGSSGTEFIVAAGSVDTFTTTAQDVLIQKYDLSLNPVWSVAYGSTAQDDAYGLAVDPVTGDVYVTGVTHLGTVGEDVILLKYSAAGSFQWARAWGGSGDESAWNVSLDGQGGIYLGGETTSFGVGASDGLLLKFNTAGDLLWSMTWGGTGSGESVGLQHAPSASGAVRAYGVSPSSSDDLNPCTGVLTVLSPSWEWTPTGSTGTLAGTLSTLPGSSSSYSSTGGGGGFDIQLLDFDRGCYPTYCIAGTTASGCQAAIASSGVPSATAASGFVLSVSSVEGQKDGLFFYGTSGRQGNAWGNGTSFQCVTPPVKRGGLLVGSGSIGSCNGSFSQDLNARWQTLPAHNPGAGALMQAQLWFRDPFNTSNQTTSLSNAIEFQVGP